MARQTALPPNLAPRLIGREAAAAYISVSPTKFDELVSDGRMPQPRIIDRRRAWIVGELDDAVERLPRARENDEADRSWEDIDAGA